MSGKLFFIEGPDGVGKTTTIDLLKLALLRRSGRFEFLSFPGRAEGTLGAVVYRIHHDPAAFGIATMSELSKQALHIAAHVDAIERLIVPALQSGTHIILDRFWWSTLVYGAAAGVHQAGLRTLVEAERLVWDRFQPALAILLDRDRPIDRDDEISSWLKLRDAYRGLALEEGSSLSSRNRIEYADTGRGRFGHCHANRNDAGGLMSEIQTFAVGKTDEIW